MARPPARFTVKALMVAVAVAAIGIVGFSEWDARYGRGAIDWARAKQFSRLASTDLTIAREIRDCPRIRSPRGEGYGCPGCRTAVSWSAGLPAVFRGLPFAEKARRERAIVEGFRAEHLRIAEEFEREADLSVNLATQFYQVARSRGGRMVTPSPEEAPLLGGRRVAEKYWSNSY